MFMKAFNARLFQLAMTVVHLLKFYHFNAFAKGRAFHIAAYLLASQTLQ